MIELVALAAITVGQRELSERTDEKSLHFYGRQPTATMLDFKEISERIQVELATSTFRLQMGTPEADTPNPQPNRSFVLMAPVRFLGKGTQPPIDDDDYAYFDE